MSNVSNWYDERGAGEPVVLLHGGIGNSADFAAQLPALAEHFHVYAPDRRGHGRTADTDAPFTYEAMADETAAFLDGIVGGPAHVIGWSDGGTVAIELALRRPDLVRKLVLIGTNFHHDGLHPRFLAELDGTSADDESLEPFRDAYCAVSPDGPDHWPLVYAKTVELWRSAPTLTVHDVARIAARTLVLVGDDDTPTDEHTLALFRALADAQLAVVPGTSHMVCVEKPSAVNQLLVEFLDDGAPKRLLPLRSAAELPPTQRDRR